MPVDTHHAAEHLRRRLADTRKRRRVTLAVAASVVVAPLQSPWPGVGLASTRPPIRPRIRTSPVAVAREFVDAVGRFDADAAISYLTNDAVVQGNLREGSDAAEQLRLTLASLPGRRL